MRTSAVCVKVSDVNMHTDHSKTLSWTCHSDSIATSNSVESHQNVCIRRDVFLTLKSVEPEKGTCLRQHREMLCMIHQPGLDGHQVPQFPLSQDFWNLILILVIHQHSPKCRQHWIQAGTWKTGFWAADRQRMGRQQPWTDGPRELTLLASGRTEWGASPTLWGSRLRCWRWSQPWRSCRGQSTARWAHASPSCPEVAASHNSQNSRSVPFHWHSTKAFVLLQLTAGVQEEKIKQ